MSPSSILEVISPKRYTHLYLEVQVSNILVFWPCFVMNFSLGTQETTKEMGDQIQDWSQKFDLWLPGNSNGIELKRPWC